MAPTFTNFYFFCFFALLLLVYYLTPVKFRYVTILIANVIFYILTGAPALVLYPISASIIAYTGSLLIGRSSSSGKKKAALIISVLLMLSSLATLKYLISIITAIGYLGINTGFTGGEGLNILVPLGISFYTFSLLSYVIDVYNGLAGPETNILKILTYGLYFPNILSGPILRYREDSKAFFEEHRLSYQNLTFGLQRMLWGLFKILVISERCARIADTVYNEPEGYRGLMIIYATFAYSVQLYSNFSGAMDLVLGISECLGINLPENFDTPYLAKTVSEYWRRWHITLGVWMKEYVFYPILRSKVFTKLGGVNKKRFGKKTGKMITTFAAMFILWLTVGMWHGGDLKYIIGSGILHFIYIVLEECFEGPFRRFYEKKNIDPESPFLNAIRIIRTFILVNLGFVFFRADSTKTALLMIKSIFKTGGSFTLGVDIIETAILVVSIVIMLAVEISNRRENMRIRISRMNIVLRWMILYALIFYTILLGYYGPGFSAAAFIYQGF